MTAEPWVAVSDGLREWGPAVANHLWQSTGFLLVAALLTLALRQNQARVRFWVWMAASLKFLVPFALLASLAAHLVPPRAAVTADSAVYFAVENVSEPFVLPAFAPPLTPARPHVPVLPLVVAGVWLAGFVAVLVLWAVRWARVARVVRAGELISSGREFDALRRAETAAGLRPGTIQLRAVAGAMEPGVFGVWMPVLAWPAAISGRLHEEHLEAVLAHEVAHVRRRDNLTAAVHMLIEAAFWFHPMVWWVGARMLAERERACDEEVVRLGGTPGAYAEGILKVCAFCVESPVPCVSGVTGADLKRRIAEIMCGRVVLQLSRAKKAALVAGVVLALAVPITFGLVRFTPVYEQILHPTGALPSFEVASIRPWQPKPLPLVTSSDGTVRPKFPLKVDPGSGAGSMAGLRGDRVDFIGNAQLLIASAYNVAPGQENRIVGAPEWSTREANRYQVKAKIEDSMYAAMQRMSPMQQRQQVELMEQSLLANRFKLKVHFETREMPVYALVVAPGGPKLTSAKQDAASGIRDTREDEHGVETTGTAVTLDDFVHSVILFGGRQVVNETGLQGKYDFKLTWGRNVSGSEEASPDAPPLATAVQQQLGLKLVTSKAPVEMIVVDHIEQPSVDGAEMQLSAAGGVQVSAEARAPFAFDVVSIRRNPAPMGPATARFEFRGDGDGLVLQDILLSSIVGSFYGYDQTFQAGMPAWVNSECYDIRAKVAEADLPAYHKLTKEQRKRMVQALLEDRFKLRTHMEQREGPVYLLKVANGGPKLQAAPAGEVYTSGPRDSNGNYAHSTVFASGPGEETAHAVAMTGFAKSLQPMVGRTVVRPA